jgi:hypothetical protein
MGLIGGGAYAALGGSARPSASGDVELQRGLVGHWKLDGNVRDATPYGRNGTMTGTLDVADRKGKAVAAKSFNGSSDKIEISNFDTTVMKNSAFSSAWTLSIWVKADAFDGTDDILLGKAGCNGGLVTNGAAGYRFVLWDSGCSSPYGIAWGPPSPTSTWHHLVGTYNNGTMKLYGNGQLIGTTTAESIYATYNDVLRIGSSGIDYWFDGSLDDARVYNRELSAAEAKALFDKYDTTIQSSNGLNGLEGHWKMDGNAKDSTPYGNNGTVTGASLTADRKARANSAYSFDGSTDYITMNSRLSPAAGSISMWVMPASSQVVSNYIFASPPVSGGNRVYIGASTTGSAITVRLGDGTTTGAGVVTANAWHHVALTWSGTTNTVYVNGLDVTTNATFTGFSAVAASVYLGCFSDGTQCFSGGIDDVRTYVRVLTSAEIQNLYRSYDSQINLNTNPTNTSTVNINAGLVGHWPLNGNAKDSTPYGNHGTVTAATLVADHRNQANSAYNFTGSPSKIEIPFNAAFNPTAAMSVGVRFKAGTVATGLQRIVANIDSGGYALYITGSGVGDACGSNNLCFRVRINGTYREVSTPSSALTSGNWYYITGTYDGTNLRLYVNNSLVATSASFPGTISGSAAALCFGTAPTGATCDSNYLDNASIGSVRIYNRAVSSTEIQALNNSLD